MTLDSFDRAFVARWHQRAAWAPPPAQPLAEPDTADRPCAATASPPGPAQSAEPALIERFLATSQRQWQALADEVEAARLAGHRTIGFAGGERGEGRTTLVRCLARVLRDRGRDVMIHDTAPTEEGWLNDKRIVLVDAGVWFPPGPIRRHRVLAASLGCDAAILVRRADREPAPARAAALAAVGVVPLGEVVTFAAAMPAEPCGAER